MSFQVNIPPSMVAKMAKTEPKPGDDAAAVEEPEPEMTGKKREDWRKLKELEEMRKAGTAPAMKDEEGKDINPHIPQYIMQAPWYIGATEPTLRHQREPDDMKKKREDVAPLDVWYKRGVVEHTVATKYRKGACENCGALTHKRKDCIERPRKVGARFTGKNIAPDEFIQPDLAFDFEGKRDRWNGYDADEHRRVIDEFQKLEEAKRQLKAQKLDRSVMEAGSEDVVTKETQNDDDEDGDKYADDMAMPGQKFETKQRITVRNLRIREDTAKYLFNLDPNSAYYDPKTRAMRENPFEKQGVDPKDLPYAGDNFVRWSGDAPAIAKHQVFAWEAYEKGADIHLNADPTKLAFLQNEYAKKKDEYKQTLKGSILDKYGGQEHLDAPPKQLLLAQTEEYVEYSRHGTLIKGQEKCKVKSRYEEDVFPQNHTTVWGSYWHDCNWGYKCCHSTIRESYCLGQSGIEVERARLAIAEEPNSAHESGDENAVATTSTADPNAPKTLLMQHLEMLQAEEKRQKRAARHRAAKRRRKHRHSKKQESSDSESEDGGSSSDGSSSSSSGSTSKSSSGSSSGSSSESSEEEDEATKKELKVKEAMQREDQRLAEVQRLMTVDERKRPYNVMYDGKGPSEEDIEAYHRKRMRDDDPMAKFMQK